MPTFRMTLEYDGTDYVGWQIQPNGRSVQEEVEKALRQVLQEAVTTVAGGRTDSGVHARGQVVSFRTEEWSDPQRLAWSLNALMPDSIVAREVRRVADSFHARYSAQKRRYRYTILREVSALERFNAWQVFYPLDVALMKQCAREIVGEHDFQSFCKADSDTPHHRCIVERASWTESGPRLVFDITANRFLYGMVRALVGTMVDVGRGHLTTEEFERIIDQKDRRAAGMAAPARGLVLEEIAYPNDQTA